MTSENKERDEILEEETVETEETTEEAQTEEPAEEKKEEPKEDESARYMRLMADFQNYKKRVEKEKSDIYSYANEKMATELLTVLDNFERALDHECSDDGFKEGMDMIFKQLFDVLGKSGLAEIAALGEEFDPNFHNAVMHIEDENLGTNVVAEVFQKGYKKADKIIRHTMVKVAN